MEERKKSEGRKSSLPSKSHISLAEIKQNFKKQMSLQNNENEIFISDPMDKADASFVSTRAQSGIIFDESMNEHYSLWDNQHIESPQRLVYILKRLEETRLIERCKRIPAISSTTEQLLMIHSQSHIDILEKSKEDFENETFKKLGEDCSVYFNKKTYESALMAAGSSIRITMEVLQNNIQNGIALIRPPGHHASSAEFSGFCFVNNAALAARSALESGVSRVLIVDWDVHHGQGIQRLFYDDPRVLYFSIHRYQEGRFWPRLRESHWDFAGQGSGCGFNLNVPLNELFMKNEDYLHIFHRLLLPVAYEFNPELVIVSCGFDAAIGCPEGMMSVTPAFFGHLTSMLMPLANGKVVVLLEGGYCLESLSESAMYTLRTLLGLPCSRLVDPIDKPSSSISSTVQSILNHHGHFWTSLLPYKLLQVPDDSSNGAKRLAQMDQQFVLQSSTEAIEGNRLKYTDNEIASNKEKLQRLRNGTSLRTAASKVCYVYDAEMEKHLCVTDKRHPERPRRTNEINKKLAEVGIIDRCLQLQSRLATFSEICLVHDSGVAELVKKTSLVTPRERHGLVSDFNSIFANEHTWTAARIATGSLLQVVDCVCAGESQSGLAVIRPPGHHAEPSEPQGFCLFNNVAVAAQYALNKYKLKRILIFDWDIHHGNGIQKAFYRSSSVLYISVHLYNNGNFFPCSDDGHSSRVGFQKGEGFNINVPWSRNGMGDGDYMAALFRIVLPVAYQFDPDLVLVSAGFDAAINDPLGGCRVSPECFAHMTHYLTTLSNGNIILALEGGYNVRSISYSMAMCAKALLGDPLPPLEAGLCPSASATAILEEVVGVQKKYWSCLDTEVHKSAKDVLDGGMDTSRYVTPPESPSDLSPFQDNAPEDKDLSSCIAAFAKMSTSSAPLANSSSSVPSASAEEATSLVEGAVGLAPVQSLTVESLADALQECGMYAVVPLPWCEHLNQVQNIPEHGVNYNQTCAECGDSIENWICLVCYNVLCGRFANAHMLEHWRDSNHDIVLSFSDLSVWCYSCESYVDNAILLEAQKSAYRSKFGEEMPG